MLYSREKLHAAAGPLMLALAYAGHCTTGSYSGGAHVIVTRDFARGRLKRAAGDALCKPAAKFWGAAFAFLVAIVAAVAWCVVELFRRMP